jgi:hypothetical protein
MDELDELEDKVNEVDHMEDMRPVSLPSGNVYHVHKTEVESFNDRVTGYFKDNSFTNVSDLSDLDRIVINEHLILRWSLWFSAEQNYWNEPIDTKVIQSQIKDFSAELRATKDKLSIDKVSRDKQKGTEDVAKYIEELQVRAKHFGIKRHKEFNLIIELWQELRGKVQLYDNCDEQEREEVRCRLEDIRKWLVEEAYPRYDEIDRVFRQEIPPEAEPHEEKALQGGQQIWIRAL